MNTVQTRTIDTADLHIVRTAVDKANKKAVKIGVPGFVLHEAAADARPIYVKDITGAERIVGYVEQTEVSVIGEAPRYAGWTFVATLEWNGDAVVIRKIAGLEEVDTASAREHLQVEWCDHCNTARARLNTYLLLHEDGTWKQVGSTCLREFLGVEVHLNLLGWNPYEGVEDNSPNRPTRIAILPLFVDTIRLVRAYGWVSSTAAFNKGGIATKARIGDAWFDFTSKGPGNEYRKAIADNAYDTDEALAETVLNWVRTVEDNSEYIANLKAALNTDTVSVTNLGLAVSAPFAYQRWAEKEQAKQAERKASAHSEYIGTVGDRLRGLKLTAKSFRWIDGYYGSTLLVLLNDEAGNAYKWFASNPSEAVENAKAGDVLVLDGTVKKHEEYNGFKSTVLTRCSVKEVVAA